MATFLNNFSKQSYFITYNKEGYNTKVEPIEINLDPFGSLIGMLIADPLTGTMHKLPKKTYAAMEENKFYRFLLEYYLKNCIMLLKN